MGHLHVNIRVKQLFFTVTKVGKVTLMLYFVSHHVLILTNHFCVL